MHIYVKNIAAKFHPGPTLNGRTLCYFWRRGTRRTRTRTTARTIYDDLNAQQTDFSAQTHCNMATLIHVLTTVAHSGERRITWAWDGNLCAKYSRKALCWTRYSNKAHRL